MNQVRVFPFPEFLLSQIPPFPNPSGSVSLLSCILPLLNSFFPASLHSLIPPFLSQIPHFPTPSFPKPLLSQIPPFPNPSISESLISCIHPFPITEHAHEAQLDNGYATSRFTLLRHATISVYRMPEPCALQQSGTEFGMRQAPCSQSIVPCVSVTNMGLYKIDKDSLTRTFFLIVLKSILQRYNYISSG